MTDKDGKVTFEYSIDKNSEIAKNLKGHLLLSTGDIDNNVHPSNTFRLADALIKANKRFDFLILPGQRHAYGPDADYVSWMRADYFCALPAGRFRPERRYVGAESRAAGQAPGSSGGRPRHDPDPDGAGRAPRRKLGDRSKSQPLRR